MNEAEKLAIRIDTLKRIDDLLRHVLFINRPDPNITLQESNKNWDDTVWHKTIIREIDDRKLKNNYL